MFVAELIQDVSSGSRFSLSQIFSRCRFLTEIPHCCFLSCYEIVTEPLGIFTVSVKNKIRNDDLRSVEQMLKLWYRCCKLERGRTEVDKATTKDNPRARQTQQKG